ncbi:DUF4890 domain-containing protein [Algoriphagus confluentis]|uniref:DUF4890 domain-containing protein n=1 Tax=Algoriphagus confluentis TaxID=1697556 RepID=A0ABQ6PV01_9BACT|nr:hypothetical protein Aconfl_41000 [Algoriphagus confluentis]
MKKWIIGAVLMVFASLSVTAQEGKRTPPSPEERAQKMTERMAEKLALTEDQKAEIFSINLENAKKRELEVEVRKAESAEKRAELKAQDERIKQILNEEQRKAWEELKEENRGRRRPEGQIHDRSEIRRGPRGDN